MHPGEVHLAIDILRYDLGGSSRLGITSRQVAERAPVGSELSIYVHESPAFRLAPRSTDLVLIGPGTGVAPFRAFLEERSLEPGSGRTWLFFGARHRASDFFYESDFQRFSAQGTLTKLDLAFSRDQAHKVYVQHKMLENKLELSQWIRGGASVYVCGDAHAMAPDVHRALTSILSLDGDGVAELARLESEGRYLRDVY
jgi:sulfite reductase (NADPH) flavoprotein alpha-component